MVSTSQKLKLKLTFSPRPVFKVSFCLKNLRVKAYVFFPSNLGLELGQSKLQDDIKVEAVMRRITITTWQWSEVFTRP